MVRKAAPRNKPRLARTATFIAPVGGWVKNQNIAKPDPTSPQGAERLVNIFPTATSAELRGGSAVYSTLGDGTMDVQSLMSYNNGTNEKMFAATNNAIYDVTAIVDPNTSPAPSVTGLTGGVWSSVQFATTGNIYLVGVNGQDLMRLYDGEFWLPIDSSNLYTVPFDNKTAAFVVGGTLTGGTSGATGTIIAGKDNGLTGFVLIKNKSTANFQDNETITGSTGGSAQVNGAQAQVFNGVTGVATSKLSYVWSFKSRLFFIEKDTLNVWYAAIDQIGGALELFPMAGIFPLGGSLLFGASWSLDTSGDGGLSAQCVFVTTEGEVAAFQGDDPSSASGWSLVGVYRIGQPLGQNAWHRAGGDLAISTTIGHVPLSQAINRSIAALSPVSVSYPIETAWNAAVAERQARNWQCILWPEKQMVLVALSADNGLTPSIFAANARTGRWCEFVGWDAKCFAIFQGRLFFGSTEGKVIEGYNTGLDQGATYTGVYVPLFSDLRTPEKLKTPQLARAVLRSNSEIISQISMQYDYVVDLPPAPNAQVSNSGSVWGDAEWGSDTAVWGGSSTAIIQQNWVSVGGSGYALAPALQFTSGSNAPLETEIVRIDVTYDIGDVLS